jgi:hypothetical protein
MLDEYIKQHCGPECLALCERMQRILPRELRDLVYEHMFELPSHDGDDILKLLQDSKYSREDYDETWMPKPQGTSISHIFDIYYVGLSTLSELAESYCRVSTFSFKIYDNKCWKNSTMGAFFAHDLIETGWKVGTLIRNLKLYTYELYFRISVGQH